jgi:hypothetical protein
VSRTRTSRAEAEAKWEAIREAAAAEETIFEFARTLRAWTWTGQPTGEGVARYIEEVFMRYGPAPGDVWDVLGLESLSGDLRAEFIAAFNSIRVAAGMGLWETAAANADARPFIPTVAPSRKYVRFVSLAGHLQRARAPGQWILLPVHRLASMLGVTARMVSQYRRWATEEGILREVQPHSRPDKRATRFIFNLDQFGADGRQRPPLHR